MLCPRWKPSEKTGRAGGKRRKFTDEFKAGATRLVLDESKTIAQVARDLDVTASVLRTWVVRVVAVEITETPPTPGAILFPM